MTDIPAIQLTHTELELLRAVFVQSWHHTSRPSSAAQTAALLDKIEVQAGFRRTRLGENTL